MKEEMREILKEYGNMMYNLNCSYEFLKSREVINTEVFKKALNACILNACIEDLNRLLKNLSEKERRILILKFGLNGNKALSLTEIADMENLSTIKIRAIIIKALRRIENDFKKV